MKSEEWRVEQWTEEHIGEVIAIWGATDLQQRSCKKSSNLRKSSTRNGDWIQCRIKIKNLKTNYKKVKDSNNKTGEGRKTCSFMTSLTEFWGSLHSQGIKDCPNRIDTEFVYNDIHALTSSHWNVLSRAWVENGAITRWAVTWHCTWLLEV